MKHVCMYCGLQYDPETKQIIGPAPTDELCSHGICGTTACRQRFHLDIDEPFPVLIDEVHALVSDLWTVEKLERNGDTLYVETIDGDVWSISVKKVERV